MTGTLFVALGLLASVPELPGLSIAAAKTSSASLPGSIPRDFACLLPTPASAGESVSEPAGSWCASDGDRSAMNAEMTAC